MASPVQCIDTDVNQGTHREQGGSVDCNTGPEPKWEASGLHVLCPVRDPWPHRERLQPTQQYCCISTVFIPHCTMEAHPGSFTCIIIVCFKSFQESTETAAQQ